MKGVDQGLSAPWKAVRVVRDSDMEQGLNIVWGDMHRILRGRRRPAVPTQARLEQRLPETDRHPQETIPDREVWKGIYSTLSRYSATNITRSMSDELASGTVSRKSHEVAVSLRGAWTGISGNRAVPPEYRGPGDDDWGNPPMRRVTTFQTLFNI
jgi:hypothetical protein